MSDDITKTYTEADWAVIRETRDEDIALTLETNEASTMAELDTVDAMIEAFYAKYPTYRWQGLRINAGRKRQAMTEGWYDHSILRSEEMHQHYLEMQAEAAI